MFQRDAGAAVETGLMVLLQNHKVGAGGVGGLVLSTSKTHPQHFLKLIRSR